MHIWEHFCLLLLKHYFWDEIGVFSRTLICAKEMKKRIPYSNFKRRNSGKQNVFMQSIFWKGKRWLLPRSLQELQPRLEKRLLVLCLIKNYIISPWNSWLGPVCSVRTKHCPVLHCSSSWSFQTTAMIITQHMETAVSELSGRKRRKKIERRKES